MLGRFQPFHDGHLALFHQALAKTGQVVIQVRDCEGWLESNPYNFETVKCGIIAKLEANGFVEGREYIIQKVPNIINITYGRDVGYALEEEHFDECITKISATQIRQKLERHG